MERRYFGRYRQHLVLVVFALTAVTHPVILVEPISTTVELFTNFTNHTLTCEASGASSYSWERQNGVIPSDSTGVNTNTLTLINLQPEDAGNYRCVATNASGSTPSDYADVTINVPPPRIIVHPMDLTRSVTETAIFTCVGQGYGLVNVSWHRQNDNRNPVTRRRRFTSNIVVTPDRISSTLTIVDLQNNDERNYWCRFDNNIGHMLSMFATLTIGVPPPNIIFHPMSMIVDIGSIVTFNCVSSSFAPVNYTWLKDGIILSTGVINNDNGAGSDEGKDNYTTTLMILDVQLSDNGLYVCNATNENGTTSSNPATLSVIMIIPPVFILDPESNVTNEMGYVELSCTATSIVSVMFQWEKFINNTWEPLPNSNTNLDVNDTTVSGTAYTSIISSINIPQSDEGNYRCRASNSAGTNISDVATITVYGPPMIVSLSDSSTIIEGDNVSFVCEADNDLDATINVTIRWFDNNNHRIRNGDDDRVTISTTMETGPNRTVMSTLTIDQVVHQDAGQYRCEALNYHDLTDSSVTRLIVEFAPIVTIAAMDQINQSEVNVTLNTTFNMTCNVDSYPPAMVHWEVDGDQVSNDTVVIVDTSIPGAIVTYTCVAVNEINGANRSANNCINVIVQAPPISEPPIITAHPKPTRDFATYSASFSCSAKGKGDVKISWRREDGEALPSKAVTAIQDSGNDEMTTTGFLIISDVTAYDMGKYCCVASNEAGEVVSDCVQLTVQIPPPVITKQPVDVRVSQGSTATFNCEAMSYGDTTYLWERVDGGELDTDRATGVNSNTLTISNPVPDDTGIYVCITNNKDGQTVSKEAVLNVIAQCPTNLSIDNGFVMFSSDSKLVAYQCFDGFKLIGSTSAECMQDGKWSSSPPKCIVDSCTNADATNCAHFTNVDDQGNVLCMCKPGYRVDLSNKSNCIDIDECKLDSTLCDKECVNTEGSYYCQCPSSYALAVNGTSCIECGISKPINHHSNGYVTRRRFSWHVQLCNSTASNDDENVLCSGSLINDQWVLTSAECVCEGQDNTGLIVNVHKTTNCSKPLNNGTSRAVALVKCHKGYKSKVVGYNVALLKLSSPVDAVPVCLSKKSISANFHDSVNAVTMTGWGFSPILRYSQLSTVPTEHCTKSYSGEYDVSFDSICTDKYDRNGHCDKGSPMVYRVKSLSSSHTWFVLVGIANEKCQATRPYDVHTSTTGTKIYQWISETTGLHI